MIDWDMIGEYGEEGLRGDVVELDVCIVAGAVAARKRRGVYLIEDS